MFDIGWICFYTDFLLNSLIELWIKEYQVGFMYYNSAR